MAFLWIVNVPLAHWEKAKELLTTAEANSAVISHKVITVSFTKEDDARAFTWLLREAAGCLLPVARAEAA